MSMHDAFISYSRVDKGFASKLEKALENFTPPKDLAVAQRHLDIFRDEKDFTGTEYHESLEKHLRDSAKLIVLCSPHARASQYVNDEIRRFAKAKGGEHIVPLLISGLPNNEAKVEQGSEKAFPDALLECVDMPLAAEYRGFNLRKDKIDKGEFENAWYTTLANLYGIARGELEQRDKKRRARRLRMLASIATAVGIGLSGLTIWALIARHEAITQSRIALSRQLGAQSQTVLADKVDLGLLLSVAGVKIQDTLEARQSLADALQSMSPRPTFLWGQDPCDAAGFSSDGRNLAMACGSTVVLWDVATHRPIGPLTDAGRSTITGLSFLPATQKLVASSLDGALLVWDLTTPTSAPRVVDTKAGNLLALAVRPDGAALALGGAPDGTIQLWSTTNWMPLDSPVNGTHGRIWSLSYSPDGALAAGTEDGSVVIWNASMRPMTLAPGHNGRVWKVVFSPDGRLVASAGNDGDVKLWNGKDGGALGSISEERAHADGATSLAISPDSKLLATGGMDHRIIVWDLSTKQPVLGPVSGHRNSVLDMQFSPNGALLASASRDHSGILWSLREENALAEVLKSHNKPVIRVNFVKDRRVLVSQSTDGSIIVWDLKRRRPAKTLAGGLGSAWFSHDFNVWAFAQKDGVLLYDMLEKKPLHKLPHGHKDEVIAGAFSPDGKILATGSKDGTVKLWDVSSGSAIGQSLEVTRMDSGVTGVTGVTGVAFGPDGTVLGTASQREIRLWDVTTHRQIGMPLVGHERRRLVFGLDFGPDNGRTVASSSFDGTITLWDASNRRQFGHLQGRHGPLLGLSFDRDGKSLAVGAQDGAVVLWKVDVGLWQSLACSIANRNLSRIEWEQYVGEKIPYVAVCPDLPHE